MDEGMRFRIHGRLPELFDHEEAAAIMSALTETDSKFDQLRAEIANQFRTQTQWTVGAIFGSTALAIAISRLG